MTEEYDKQYERQVQKWGAQIAKEKGFEVPKGAKFAIEGRRGSGGGCDTCGYGSDDGGMEVDMTWVENGRARNKLIATFDFSEINIMIKGIWRA